MITPPGWELYRSFLAVIQEGSLSGAARSLALTQPTIGRHVDALEQALGIALFTRSQNGLSPTAAALDLMPHAEAMAASAEALIRAASGEAGEARGVVRLTAPVLLGVEVLPPILTRFHEQHPGIVLELALTNRTEDLLRHEADLAVRMVQPTQGALVAKRIGTTRIALYARRRYIETHGLPTDLDQMRRHTVIGFDRSIAPLRGLGELAVPITRETFAFRCDNELAQLAALRAGYGIAVCHLAIAARDPELMPVLHDKLMFELDIWIVMHEDLRASRRVRLIFDHLVEHLTTFVGR
jgi:DNA-binding transcriptional LysR family regulator